MKITASTRLDPKRKPDKKKLRDIKDDGIYYCSGCSWLLVKRGSNPMEWLYVYTDGRVPGYDITGESISSFMDDKFVRKEETITITIEDSGESY